MNPMEQLPEKIEELVHELSVLPYNDMHFKGVVPPTTLTNYGVWLIIASLTVLIMFVVVANKDNNRLERYGTGVDLPACNVGGKPDSDCDEQAPERWRTKERHSPPLSDTPARLAIAALDDLPRSWEGEAPSEPRRSVALPDSRAARPEPRPPEISGRAAGPP